MGAVMALAPRCRCYEKSLRRRLGASGLGAAAAAAGSGACQLALSGCEDSGAAAGAAGVWESSRVREFWAGGGVSAGPFAAARSGGRAAGAGGAVGWGLSGAVEDK